MMKKLRLMLLGLLCGSLVREISAIGLIDDSSYLAKSAAEASVRPSGSYGNHQTTINKFLPEGISQSDKLRAFLECRRECIAKCDRLVYIYADKKEFCHDCIRQCMMSFLQQAKSLGIDFNTPSTSRDQMLGDAPTAADIGEKRRRRGGGGGGGGGGGRRRRNKRKQRRQQRQMERQALLKNCIVHK